MVGRRGVI
jgi:adrenodoxin-NADP+ reductase